MKSLQDYVNTVGILEPDNPYYNRMMKWCEDADKNEGVIPYDIMRSEERKRGEEKALQLFQLSYEKKYGFYVPKRAVDRIVNLLRGMRVMALDCNPGTVTGYLIREGIEVLPFDSENDAMVNDEFNLSEVSRLCGVEPIQMKPAEAIKKYGDDVDIVFYKHDKGGANRLPEILGALREMDVEAPVLYIGSDWFSLLKGEPYFKQIETYSDLNLYLIQKEYVSNNVFYRPWIIHDVIR